MLFTTSYSEAYKQPPIEKPQEASKFKKPFKREPTPVGDATSLWDCHVNAHGVTSLGPYM